MFINSIKASVHCSIVAIVGEDLSQAHNSPFTKFMALSLWSRIWVSNKPPRSRYWPLKNVSLFEKELLTPNVTCTLGFGKTTLPGISRTNGAAVHCCAIWLWLAAKPGSTTVADCWTDSSCSRLCSPYRYLPYFRHDGVGLPARFHWRLCIPNFPQKIRIYDYKLYGLILLIYL